MATTVLPVRTVLLTGTGTLLCSSTAGIGAVQLCKGRITGAASPKTKGLQEYLIEMGIVTDSMLERVSAAEREEKALVGGILVRLGLVSAEQVRQGLRAQIRDAIRELMSWGVGRFAFDPETPMELSASDVEIEIDPQETLLDIFKELDERNRSNS